MVGRGWRCFEERERQRGGRKEEDLEKMKKIHLKVERTSLFRIITDLDRVKCAWHYNLERERDVSSRRDPSKSRKKVGRTLPRRTKTFKNLCKALQLFS